MRFQRWGASCQGNVFGLASQLHFAWNIDRNVPQITISLSLCIVTKPFKEMVEKIRCSLMIAESLAIVLGDLCEIRCGTLELAFSEFRRVSFLFIIPPLLHKTLITTSEVIKQTPWREYASELYLSSDRRLSAKLVPTFTDRGCRVVSVTEPHGRILGFLDRSRQFSFRVAPHPLCKSY
jgi:hypothetical protein